MLLDFCHSGSLLENQEIRKALTVFGLENDYYLIAGCRSFEKARAFKGEAHSIFTGALLKGLSVENANPDGTVTTELVFNEIDNELKNSGQEPIYIGGGRSIILVRYLQVPVKTVSVSQKWGIPFQAPPLSSHFVDRPEVSQDLKKRLIEGSTTHSGTLVISAIQGLGGIGKTILAQALAQDRQVQERFCDGILWATLGQQPDVLSLLQGWIVALKDYDFKPTTVNAASSHLNSLLHDKAVLLVVDDGWNVEDIEPFRVGSGKCQVIITTRRADVAEEVDAQLYSLDLMSEEQSLMLLARRLGRELEKEEQAAAKKLADSVGYLPLALDLAAAKLSNIDIA